MRNTVRCCSWNDHRIYYADNEDCRQRRAGYYHYHYHAFAAVYRCLQLDLTFGAERFDHYVDKNLTGITLPSIYGFPGMLLVFTMQLYPLIYLYVSGALKNMDNSLLEAAENFGCTGIKRVFRVVLPLIAPMMLSGGLLVFMRSMADFGTPQLIGEGYRTMPYLIYNEFISEMAATMGLRPH